MDFKTAFFLGDSFSRRLTISPRSRISKTFLRIKVKTKRICLLNLMVDNLKMVPMGSFTDKVRFMIVESLSISKTVAQIPRGRKTDKFDETNR